MRFVTAFTRAQRDGRNYYLLFEWADRGSLRDLWKTNPMPEFSTDLVRHAVRQLSGLADALSYIHRQNFRHGDLKPENILVFSNGDPTSPLGTLKIGDWGLAKQHSINTEMRRHDTSTKHGTRRYEPPEVITKPVRFRRYSRLYDTWASGCVMLEFIIWLLHGYDEVRRFEKHMNGDSSDAAPFYELGADGVATVHPVVSQWMKHMLEQDPECKGSTAMSRLLDIVQNQLLVVSLPTQMGGIPTENRPPSSDDVESNLRIFTPGEPEFGPHDLDLFAETAGNLDDTPKRARADEVHRSLDAILTITNEANSIWYNGARRESVPKPSHGLNRSIPRRSQFLSPDAAARARPPGRQSEHSANGSLPGPSTSKVIPNWLNIWKPRY